MDFRKLHEQLVAKGYNDDTADAKIAHDIVLKAIDAAGFRDNLTVKGGVVMSGITDLVRRATMDKGLREPAFASLDVPAEEATKAIVDFLATL